MSGEENGFHNNEIDKKKKKKKRKKKEVKSDDDLEGDDNSNKDADNDSNEEPKGVYASYFNPLPVAKKGMGFICSNKLLSSISVSYECFCYHLQV